MSGAHEVIRPKQNIKKAMYKQKWNYAKKKKNDWGPPRFRGQPQEEKEAKKTD